MGHVYYCNTDTRVGTTYGTMERTRVILFVYVYVPGAATLYSIAIVYQWYVRTNQSSSNTTRKTSTQVQQRNHGTYDTVMSQLPDWKGAHVYVRTMVHVHMYVSRMNGMKLSVLEYEYAVVIPTADSRGVGRPRLSGVRECRGVLLCICSFSQPAALYPLKTHVVLRAHVCSFPIRVSCDIT